MNQLNRYSARHVRDQTIYERTEDAKEATWTLLCVLDKPLASQFADLALVALRAAFFAETGDKDALEQILDTPGQIGNANQLAALNRLLLGIIGEHMSEAELLRADPEDYYRQLAASDRLVEQLAHEWREEDANAEEDETG